MHISCVYLSGYSAETVIKGHINFTLDGTNIEVQFSDDEAAEVQEIATKAWHRHQARLAQRILESSPALVALPAPAQEEEAIWTDASDDVSF